MPEGDDPVEAAWDAFCDQLSAKLKAAARRIADESRSTLDRNEGLRLLLRDLRYSLERDIEERNVDFPLFELTIRDTIHHTADSPDYAIQTAAISGTNQYRIHGLIGAADELNFTTQRGFETARGNGSALVLGEEKTGAGVSTPSPITGTLEFSDLSIDADGRFEIIVSCDRPTKGVWLPITPETKAIIARNIYHSSFRKHRRYRPARLVIEKVGAPYAPPPYSAMQLLGGLRDVLSGAGTALNRRAILTRDQPRRNGEFSNIQDPWKDANPRTHFQDAIWEIEENEAMIIDVDPLPRSSYWSLIFTNAWMESLDFRYHRMYLTSNTAVLRDDGGMRIIVSQQDPNTANWIDTAFHTRGAMVWRWNDVERIPTLPRARVVAFEDLPMIVSADA